MAPPLTDFHASAAPLLAAAMLALAPSAYAAAPASEAKSAIDLKVVIPVVLRIRSVSQATELAIAPADVARGYVDVNRATRLRVTSNDPSGVAISLAFDRGLVSRVEARIAGANIQAGSGDGSIVLPAARLDDAPLDVAYRLFLAPGTRAGTYRWPVALAFGPAG